MGAGFYRHIVSVEQQGMFYVCIQDWWGFLQRIEETICCLLDSRNTTCITVSMCRVILCHGQGRQLFHCPIQASCDSLRDQSGWRKAIERNSGARSLKKTVLVSQAVAHRSGSVSHPNPSSFFSSQRQTIMKKKHASLVDNLVFSTQATLLEDKDGRLELSTGNRSLLYIYRERRTLFWHLLIF